MPMFKKQMVVVLTIALTAIVGTMYATTSEEVVRLDAGVERADRVDDERAVEPTGGNIFVYVTGAVNSPGMFELNGSDLHLADAVNAAGGLLPTADTDNINMAETISDGQHIRVPEKLVMKSVESNDISSDQSNGGGISAGGVVNINTAGVEELDTLPGIGPSIAQRIIDYRQLNGGFKSIDEIQNVSGIGQKKFEKLKSRIRI